MIISDTKRWRNIKYQSSHTTYVWCSHWSSRDWHVVQITLSSGWSINCCTSWCSSPDVSTRCTDIWPSVLLIHTASRWEWGNCGTIVSKGSNWNCWRSVSVDVGFQSTRTFSTITPWVRCGKDYCNAIFKGQPVGYLGNHTVWIVITIGTPWVRNHSNVVRVLTWYWMNKRPFQTLLSCENRCTVTGS